jgi:NAD(P)-dependent dehydrogenase (short-subunit alcohol dehydrogenase family)
MVRFAVETYGRLDCAFNNAGVEKPSQGIVDYPQEDWDEVIAINLTGVWLCMKHEIKQMLAQGGGTIVNNSSTDGLVADTNAAYVASKHGVVGLTKSVALECARQNIRVNAVCPGWVRTPMVTEGVTEAQVQATVEREEPVGRIGEPEEVARAAAWLCSDAASFITGAALPVDGGFVAK